MIANHLGIKIEYQSIQDDTSGCLLRDKDGNTVIGVNSLHHENRQRFTIAHELGHYLLHKGELTFIDKKFKRINFRGGSSVSTDTVDEIEANRFAGELLMPQEFLIKDILKSDDIEDGGLIGDLAKRYKVSRQALTIRLTTLNLS